MSSTNNNSSEEYNESIYQAAKNNQTINNDNTVNRKKSIGYVDGYAQYISKSGGPITDGSDTYREVEVTHEDASESEKPAPISKQINKQLNQFRNIFGYNLSQRHSDSMEDPSFLIFDIQMDYGESPLFNSVQPFFDDYAGSMEELNERIPIYNEFKAFIAKVFPGDINEETGSKRHYINSISGMDNLFKKIVSYPDDVLTFTLSEDITMFSQYISELYSNLIYSYDSHRYMIPDNLLRFNLTIFFRDVREMKANKYNSDGSIDRDNIKNMSKFAYVLHDCQFDFFNSRSFGNDMTVSGFEVGASATPNTLAFNINYKSYSKKTMPSLIDNGVLIDLRERDGLRDGGYDRFNNDYMSLEEQDDLVEQNLVIENTKINQVRSGNINGIVGKDGKKKSPILNYTSNIKNAFTQEISDVRNVLVNKIKDEVTVLSSQAQRFVSDKIFDTIDIPGFQNITLTKFNVYYDDPAGAIDRVSTLLENFIDDQIEDVKDSISIDIVDGRLNVNYDKTEDIDPRTGNVTDTTEKGRRQANVSSPIENIYGDVTNSHKEPEREKLHEDRTYNEKYPDGDLMDDGSYNEKEPKGKVHEDAEEVTKEPNGNTYGDVTDTDKEPSGNVYGDVTDIDKEPEGKVHDNPDSTNKEPEGDLHVDGTYNEKEPSGNLYESSEELTKEPSGNLYTISGPTIENIKEPEGKVHEAPETQSKEPEGDLHEDGTYNEKSPSGEVYGDVEGKDNTPSGNIYGKVDDIEPKQPEGDLHEDGKYNDKKPTGNRYKKEDN